MSHQSIRPVSILSTILPPSRASLFPPSHESLFHPAQHPPSCAALPSFMRTTLPPSHSAAFVACAVLTAPSLLLVMPLVTLPILMVFVFVSSCFLLVLLSASCFSLVVLISGTVVPGRATSTASCARSTYWPSSLLRLPIALTSVTCILSLSLSALGGGFGRGQSTASL